MDKYRGEIDGLRGIAILGVVIYHAELLFNNNHLFPGGFLGVDIFLVISGFLITRIINDEYTREGKFSFKKFYQRRFRRLIPALTVVVIISTIFAFFTLYPSQFLFFLKSAFSSIFFFSNIFFHYAGESYGQSVLTTIPLLHTWSLSLEEQFYLFFPIMLFIIYKFREDKVNLFLILFFLISFIFAVTINPNHPSFNFYMLPSRGWEFILGALLAVNEKKFYFRQNSLWPSLFSNVGLILIFYSYVYLKSTNEHPGLNTLLPTFGTALIIFGSSSNNYINFFLSNNIIKKLGLISYSLYLWHHPIFSFSKILGLNNEDITIKIFLIIISIISAYLSFKFIEQNFRNGKFKFKKLLVLSSTTLSSFFFIVLFSISTQKNYFPKITQDLYEKTWFKTKQYFKPCFQRKKYFCEFTSNDGNEKIFLVGSSVMASFQQELKESLLSEGLNFIPMTNPGCDFIRVTEIGFGDKFCNNIIQMNRKNRILQEKNGTIIIHLNYKNDYSKKDVTNFLKDVNFFLKKGYKIILIYPIPQLEESVSKKIDNLFRSSNKNLSSYLNDYKNYLSLDYSKFKKESENIFEIFENIYHEKLYSIYPHDIFCNNLIRNECIAHDNNDIFYIDGAHLSRSGSMLINKEIMKIINTIYK